MDFIYRSVAFEPDVTGALAQDAKQTGTFLGKRSPIKQAQVTYRQSATEFKYRGIG